MKCHKIIFKKFIPAFLILLLNVSPVNAAPKPVNGFSGSEQNGTNQGEGVCSPNNTYYNPTILADIGSSYVTHGSGIIYDITKVELTNDEKLELEGWAFNKRVDGILGSSGNTEVKIEVRLQPLSNKSQILDDDKLKFDIGYSGGTDLTYWLCDRTSKNAQLDQNGLASGGMCRAGSLNDGYKFTTTLQGNFKATIDLSKIKQYIEDEEIPDDDYVIVMKVDSSFGGYNNGSKSIKFSPETYPNENEWFTVAASETKGKGLEGNKTIKISGLSEKAKVIVESARILGESGFYCDSIAAKNGYAASNTKFKQNEVYTVVSSDKTAFRGSISKSGESKVTIYGLNIAKPSGGRVSKGSWGVAYAAAPWVQFTGTIVLNFKGCNPKTMCCYDESGNYLSENNARNASKTIQNDFFDCVDENGNIVKKVKNAEGKEVCPVQVTPCKKESTACEDDVVPTVCYEDGAGTDAHFYENKDMRNCTLQDGIQSGFSMLKEKFQLDNLAEEHTYCKVACKEKIDLSFPSKKFSASGRYFKLDQYIPELFAERTCVTNDVKYGDFQKDMTDAEKELVIRHNGAQDDAYIINGIIVAAAKYGGTIAPPVSSQFTLTGTRDGNLDRGNSRGSGSCTDTIPGVIPRYYRGNLIGFDDAHVVWNWTTYIWKGHNTMQLSPTHVHVENRLSWAGLISSKATEVGANGGKTYNLEDTKRGYSPEGYPVGACTCCNSVEWVPNEEAAKKDVVSKYASIASGKQGHLTGMDGDYLAYEQKYKDAQKTYRMCTSTNPVYDSWLTLRDTYGYKFKPEVSFEYEDIDGTRIHAEELFDYEKDVEVIDDKTNHALNNREKMEYWKNGTRANDEYTDFNSNVQQECAGLYNLLDCRSSGGNTTCNWGSASTIHGTNCVAKSGGYRTGGAQSFANDNHIKRVETYNYRYHMPTIQTIIPNGRVEVLSRYRDSIPDTSISDGKIVLESEAVPVNINTVEGTYDYKIYVKDIINEKDRDVRKAVRNFDPELYAAKRDNFEDRFYYTDGKGALNDGANKRYLCNYDVVNEIYDPVKQRVKFFYKPVDLTEANPLGRERGYNWNPTYTPSVPIIEERMIATGNDLQYLTNDSNVDKFEFILTPEVMKAIRKYNKEVNEGYSDWNMLCTGESGKKDYYCESYFLNCLTKGTNCERINRMGNANGLYDAYSKVANNDLNSFDRDILKQKLISLQSAGTQVGG